eukprot:TRINITY_DN1628_c0_g1_i1.p1 TRINITY_DN1628_c0_g1~~TRINITY_DN1628_c0_g1_i1.p1  ORF type:complete len:617 (-),score=171.34 TRINITY_DN1628_c0_g1_i1:177-2027(-)
MSYVNQRQCIKNVQELSKLAGLNVEISTIDDCTISLLIALYEILNNICVPSIIRYPETKRQYVHNASSFIDFICANFGIDNLDHIDTLGLVENRPKDVCDLVEIIYLFLSNLTPPPKRKIEQTIDFTECKEEMEAAEDYKVSQFNEDITIISPRISGTNNYHEKKLEKVVTPKNSISTIDTIEFKAPNVDERKSEDHTDSIRDTECQTDYAINIIQKRVRNIGLQKEREDRRRKRKAEREMREKEKKHQKKIKIVDSRDQREEIKKKKEICEKRVTETRPKPKLVKHMRTAEMSDASIRENKKMIFNRQKRSINQSIKEIQKLNGVYEAVTSESETLKEIERILQGMINDQQNCHRIDTIHSDEVFPLRNFQALLNLLHTLDELENNDLTRQDLSTLKIFKAQLESQLNILLTSLKQNLREKNVSRKRYEKQMAAKLLNLKRIHDDEYLHDLKLLADLKDSIEHAKEKSMLKEKRIVEKVYEQITKDEIKNRKYFKELDKQEKKRKQTLRKQRIETIFNMYENQLNKRKEYRYEMDHLNEILLKEDDKLCRQNEKTYKNEMLKHIKNVTAKIDHYDERLQFETEEKLLNSKSMQKLLHKMAKERLDQMVLVEKVNK